MTRRKSPERPLWPDPKPQPLVTVDDWLAWFASEPASAYQPSEVRLEHFITHVLEARDGDSSRLQLAQQSARFVQQRLQHADRATTNLVEQAVLLSQEWQRFYFDKAVRHLVRMGERKRQSGAENAKLRLKGKYPLLETFAVQTIKLRGDKVRGIAGLCVKENARRKFTLTGGKERREETIHKYLQRRGIVPGRNEKRR